MVSQGCAHVIEPAALRRNVQYKVLRGIKLMTTQLYMNPRYIYIARSEQNNCQMNELMFQAGVKGMSERSELIPCNYIILLHVQGMSERSELIPFRLSHLLKTSAFV